MAYVLLGKLYYGDQAVYAKEYQARFSSEEAVKPDFSVAGHPAFFLLNGEVMGKVYAITKLNQAVAKLSGMLPGIAKQQYSRKCLIDEIVLSNRIEGVHSSRKDIGDALDVLEQQSEEKGKRQQFVGLVNKYLKLMTHAEIPLRTCQDIRAIYDEVLLDEIRAEDPKNLPDGEIFRKDLTEIRSETDRVIHKGMYPEREIIAAMEKALAFLNDEGVDRLIRVCIFHYMLEYIHPFYDGNGRLGRLILSYCIAGELEPLLALRISETVKENIKDYYKAFQVCNDPHGLGDLTPFLLMMLDMIHAALAELKESLTQKLSRWGKGLEMAWTFADEKDIDARKMYNVLIQAALFSEKGISTRELEGIFGSYYLTKKNLGKIRPELLRAEKKGKEMYYELDLNTLDGMMLREGMVSIHAPLTGRDYQ